MKSVTKDDYVPKKNEYKFYGSFLSILKVFFSTLGIVYQASGLFRDKAKKSREADFLHSNRLGRQREYLSKASQGDAQGRQVLLL